MRGKLVRDKIPQIIEKNDTKKPRTKKLSPKAFERELRRKLLEEATEAVRARGTKLAEELADLEEVVDALRKVSRISRTQIVRVRRQKRSARGGFDKRIFLIV